MNRQRGVKRRENWRQLCPEQPGYWRQYFPSQLLFTNHRLAGLVVKASAAGAEDPGFESRLPRDFSGSSHTSDFKIGTPVATLLGVWC